MSDKVMISQEDLFFSKEAADFLNISVQRLNQLTKEGKIIPFKKNTSGTVYLLSELQKRQEELRIFEEVERVPNNKNEFEIDSLTKQEAVNFSTIQIATGLSEKRLSSRFDEINTRFDISRPISDNYATWSEEFDIDSEYLRLTYSNVLQAFKTLNRDDEIISKDDYYYPQLLKQTEEAPRFLYLRGDKKLLRDTRTVALVGSRAASDAGKHNTARVAKALGKNGIVIVSGLAKGIDASAHIAALENGFKTIAVIGTSLNQYYPKENSSIQKEIEKKGLVVSQFSPALKTERWFFPLRNGVMSGLSMATVVMEAGQTSGALIQARIALKQKRLVLIPQNALEIKTIDWPQKLVKKGAVIVTSPQDIIDKLIENNVYKPKSITKDLFDDLDPIYEQIAEKEPKYDI